MKQLTMERRSIVNVGTLERWLSLAAGTAMVATAVKRRRSVSGLVLVLAGTALLARGLSGHCFAYAALGVNTAPGEHPGNLPIRVEHAVTVCTAPGQLYSFWRDFTNLPQVMEHLESVLVLDDTRSHWVARGPAGTTLEWDAEIVNDVPGERIGWRSVEGADVDHAGSVHFRELPGGRGTEVKVVVRYNPAGGVLGAAVAQLLGDDPAAAIAEDLRRFKQLVETAEIPTTEGQPVGTA
jgi:uncharacterized membrane protein